MTFTYIRATLKYVEKQNITLAIRKDLLQRVKILAVRQSTSVSAMLSEVLEDLVRREEGYRAARRQHTRALREGCELGTYGTVDWSRDDLHGR